MCDRSSILARSSRPCASSASSRSRLRWTRSSWFTPPMCRRWSARAGAGSAAAAGGAASSPRAAGPGSATSRWALGCAHSSSRPQPGVTDVPYRSKQNLGFWRGAVWPARRCGDWRRSPRVLMCQASQKHPDVLNASLGSLQCGPKEPSELCELIRTWRPHRVNFSEQFQYRFLLTSTPKCTYTGRMTPFLSSTSVVAMFSNGEEAVGQVLHGAFEEDVHFKYFRAHPEFISVGRRGAAADAAGLGAAGGAERQRAQALGLGHRPRHAPLLPVRAYDALRTEARLCAIREWYHPGAAARERPRRGPALAPRG
ncbi:unnamed protein product [Effrenium voratum]|nr:unnamed protein product [Effrenium voratum]